MPHTNPTLFGQPASPVAQDIFRRARRTTEREAVDALIPGLADADPHWATPPGHRYVERHTRAKRLHGTTLFFSPHPSDVSGDFFPEVIKHLCAHGSRCRQVLITRGEKGDESKSEAEVLAIRKGEEARAAAITGLNTDYLTTEPLPNDGQDHFYDNQFYFPDGALMEHLPQLTERLKACIRAEKPQRIAIPSLYPDHPDHVATAIAVINALKALRDEGFFKEHGEIEVFASDPEFANANGQPWAVEQLSKTDQNLLHRYRYTLSPTGLVQAVDDITDPTSTLLELPTTPLAIPPVILRATHGSEVAKIAALLEHETQVFGKEVNYGERIPLVARLRGWQAAAASRHPVSWGVGFYPVYISGVTSAENSLLDSLPKGNVFQLACNESPHVMGR